MKIFGLIGHPLTHSFSKKYFEAKFEKLKLNDYEYNLYDIDEINKLAEIRKNVKNLVGLNVTIPYKEAVFPYLDNITEIAKQIGSVNTIKCSKSEWFGFNTDYYGILKSIKSLPEKKINGSLILGSGGTSKTVNFVLNELGIENIVVSRKKTDSKIINYNEITSEKLLKYNLIINTSPMGMYPEISNFPDIPYHLLSEKNILFDMIYNPEQTIFLKNGKDKGCISINGLESLQVQAEESWKIWNS